MAFLGGLMSWGLKIKALFMAIGCVERAKLGFVVPEVGVKEGIVEWYCFWDADIQLCQTEAGATVVSLVHCFKSTIPSIIF